MWFWITMFICNLVLPLIMVLAGYMMYKHTPKFINRIYGYRTNRSMKNMDTWKFANKYCGKLWFRIGLILLVPSVVVQLPFINSSDNLTGNMTLLIEAIQLFAAIVPIFFVEKALKINFDENGRRKIQ
ncbi:MAG: SdpI family protein [Lachnoclostridium sp.]|jgi:uncharacterized membrane protein